MAPSPSDPGWGYCGKNCPVDVNPWSKDNTLKVTSHILNQNEMKIAMKLLGIVASSLLLTGVMVTCLGFYSSINMRNDNHHCLAMMISNTYECLEDKDERRVNWKIIKKFLKIFSVLLIIFTTIFFTFFGCFLVLNQTGAAQTVTLSSEGGVNETYPDSMGEFQLAGEIEGGDVVYNWYRHKDREDRFLMYNSLGNIEY